MSILIKGVEMPEKGECGMILFVYASGKVCINVNRKVGEAVPVPAPHGPLVDVRVAYDEIAEAAFELDHLDMDTVDKGLSCTPTVIEAEE